MAQEQIVESDSKTRQKDLETLRKHINSARRENKQYLLSKIEWIKDNRLTTHNRLYNAASSLDNREFPHKNLSIDMGIVRLTVERDKLNDLAVSLEAMKK